MSIIHYRRTPSYRHSPLAQLSQLHREMNRLFDISSDAGWNPALDLVQDQDRVEVTVELPGLKKEDISISLENGVLSISGERKDEIKREDGETRQSERFFGRFQRTVELPVEVDPNQTTASYQNGVLKVVLTKVQAAKPKQININVS